MATPQDITDALQVLGKWSGVDMSMLCGVLDKIPYQVQQQFICLVQSKIPYLNDVRSAYRAAMLLYTVLKPIVPYLPSIGPAACGLLALTVSKLGGSVFSSTSKPKDMDAYFAKFKNEEMSRKAAGVLRNFQLQYKFLSDISKTGRFTLHDVQKIGDPGSLLGTGVEFLGELGHTIQSLLHQRRGATTAKQVIQYLELYSELAVLRDSILWQAVCLTSPFTETTETAFAIKGALDKEAKEDKKIFSIIYKPTLESVFVKAILVSQTTRGNHSSLLSSLGLESMRFEMDQVNKQTVVLRTNGYVEKDWYVSHPKLGSPSVYLSCTNKGRTPHNSGFLFLKADNNCYHITPRGPAYHGYFLSVQDGPSGWVVLRKGTPNTEGEWVVIKTGSGYVISSCSLPLKFLAMSGNPFHFGNSWLCCQDLDVTKKDEMVWTLEPMCLPPKDKK